MNTVLSSSFSIYVTQLLYVHNQIRDRGQGYRMRMCGIDKRGRKRGKTKHKNKQKNMKSGDWAASNSDGSSSSKGQRHGE